MVATYASPTNQPNGIIQAKGIESEYNTEVECIVELRLNALFKSMAKMC